MGLQFFDALLPYFGGKRKLCPVIFGRIAEHLPRNEWQGKVFVDAFLGSGAVSLYAKAQGFRIIANDIAERSVIAGKALLENSDTYLTDSDLYALYLPNPQSSRLIEKQFVPDIFTRMHGIFLDKAFANAKRPLDKFLLLKYLFSVRPYSKFSSPNAFNRPMDEGRYDEIKSTYASHINDNLKTPLELLKMAKDRINAGIFSNGLKNEVHKQDVFEFIESVPAGDVLYLDPPYAGTLAYEDEYGVLDAILNDTKRKSGFSGKDGMELLEALLEKSDKFPLWVISFGNAAGQNDLSRLTGMVSRFRKCEAKEFEYRHCEAMASEAHKAKCREWLVMGWK